MARTALTLVLLVAIAALAWWAVTGGTRAEPLPLSVAQPEVPRPDWSDDDRIFLTLKDSRIAARKGLVPAGARSIIDTDGTLKYGEWHWDDKGVPPGPLSIRVDLKRQLVSIFRGPHEIGTAVIVYGANGKETPRGRLPILGKTRDYHSRTYDAPMPYSLWLRDDGVAIHGSTVTSGHATNGCIGVPNEFAAHLFDVAKKGDIVEVIGDGTQA